MISKKDLSNAEMDTLTNSCSPTIVITANGEVQTHEEATVHVKELGIFLTMKVLENTPAVLSLGKLCDFNMCARGAGTNGDVLNAHTWRRVEWTHGVFPVCHTTHHTPPHNTEQHTTTHGDRGRKQRQTETEEEDRERRQGQREKGRRKRRDKTREEKTKEDKTRQEKREDSFSVWWCMAVLSWWSDLSG